MPTWKAPTFYSTQIFSGPVPTRQGGCCRRRVSADNLFDVRNVKAVLGRGVVPDEADYVCDACASRMVREKDATREQLASAQGAPQAHQNRMRGLDQRDARKKKPPGRR